MGAHEPGRRLWVTLKNANLPWVNGETKPPDLEEVSQIYEGD